MSLGFYFDDNCANGAVVAALRLSAIRCVTSDDAGKRGVSDETHLEFAASVGLSLVSSDEDDFPAMHWRWLGLGRRHAGIVVVRQRKFAIGEQIARLRRLAVEVDAADMHDRIEYLSDWG